MKLVLVVAALTVLTACNAATAGQPKPVQTTPQPTVETTESAHDYSLARLCELLSPEEAQQLGGSPEGEEGNALNDGHDICSWSDETHLLVGFQTGTSTAQADTGPDITNTPTTVDGLPAVQALTTGTVVICEILVDLPSGQMFAVSATVLSAGEGKYDPCEVATALADLVVPRVANE